MHKAMLQAGAGVALVRLAGMAAGFTLTVILARALGPKGIGVYGYMVMLVTLAAIPINSGWSTLLLRSTVQARSGKGEWGGVAGLFWWGLRLAFGLTVLLILASSLFVFGIEGQERLSSGGLLLTLLSTVLFFNQLSSLRMAVLRGLDHPVWGQVPETLIRPVLILIVFLVLDWIRAGEPNLVDAFIALSAASIIAALAGGMILLRLEPNVFRTVPKQNDLRGWGFNATVLASNAGLVLLNAHADFLILGVLGTPEELGHYRVAMQIGVLGGFVYTSLNFIAMQRFALFFADGAQDNLQMSAVFLARLAFLGAIPLPIIFWIWGKDILAGLFGLGFEVALTPILWFLGLQLLNAGVGFPRTILVMAGFESRLVPITLGSLIINVILCFSLVPAMGAEGAAISSFVSIGCWNIALLVVTYREIKIDSSMVGYVSE